MLKFSASATLLVRCCSSYSPFCGIFHLSRARKPSAAQLSRIFSEQFAASISLRIAWVRAVFLSKACHTHLLLSKLHGQNESEASCKPPTASGNRNKKVHTQQTRLDMLIQRSSPMRTSHSRSPVRWEHQHRCFLEAMRHTSGTRTKHYLVALTSLMSGVPFVCNVDTSLVALSPSIAEL